MKNFLKYTGLTYDEIVRQVTDKLNSDERFANFRESAIAQTLVEIFAGAVDIVNYNLERRAEESFFDTARLRSSVMLLARSLGYVIQRPVPAEATIKLKIKGQLTLNANATVQIPIHSVFSYNGLKFVLKKTLTLNASDFSGIVINEGAETDFISSDFNGDSIELAQGEIKEKFIDGLTNPQIGSTFQIYRIEDKEFSNRYGDEDFDTPITKVWVGNLKSDATEYDINRRSLIDWNVIEAAQSNEVQNVCVIRTAITEGVEVLFGDGRFAQLGASTSGQAPATSNDNVYVQYFATKGSEANQVGVKDKKIQFAGKVFDSNGNDITSKVEFYFASNITGGADIEDIDSIRINAPNIYYTLDRLVAKRDYVNYLKSLTSPIDVKNAIAWGEQEELNKRGMEAMLRMFNVVFFSLVGPLYQTSNSPYYVKTKANGLDTAVLDYGYDDDELNQRNYFNVFTKGFSLDSSSLVEQLKEYQTTTFVWKIKGNEVETSADAVYYVEEYGESMPLTIKYTTSIVANNPSLSASIDVLVDVRSLDGLNYSDAMNELASVVTNKLLSITDQRGVNVVQNANYNQVAFTGISISFSADTGSKDKFVITHGLDTPAYIYSIEGLGATDMGISSAAPFEVTTDRQLSKKVIDVVEDLDKRSQVTIRNIYISPIIQSIQLVGKVYLKDLYDKQTEKTNIEDAIYKWFNDNADFNNEIYISNVIELIEQFPSVFYADVRFVPEVPVNPAGGKFFNGSNHPSIEKAFTDASEKEIVYSNILAAINNYILGVNQTDTSGNTEKDLSYNSTNVQIYDYQWNNSITERTFLEVFAKGLYNTFNGLGENYRIFANSDDFINLLSDIRKDYLKIIRFNLIDTNGNIAEDEQLILSGSDVGKPIKGGYSLGCEIVKINVNVSYEYKR